MRSAHTHTHTQMRVLIIVLSHFASQLQEEKTLLSQCLFLPPPLPPSFFFFCFVFILYFIQSTYMGAFSMDCDLVMQLQIGKLALY